MQKQEEIPGGTGKFGLGVQNEAQFSSVAQSCSTLCNPMNHILCHPLLLLPSIFPSHQGLFKQVSSSHQMATVLEFQLHNQSFE